MSDPHPGPTPSEPFRLMVMCTANRCRSPMAEVLAVQHLGRRGVDALVVSCGTMDEGIEATRGSRKAMAKRGLDLSTHRSKRIDAETLRYADLILTMERRHLGAVAELSMDALQRAFTLKELADLAAMVGPRPRSTTAPGWISRANAMRIPGTTLVLNTDDDIADPMGGSMRDYRRTAEEKIGRAHV